MISRMIIYIYNHDSDISYDTHWKTHGKHQPSPTVVFLWRQPGNCSTKVPPILGLHAVARPTVHSSAIDSWQLETRFVKGKVALSLLGARNWLIILYGIMKYPIGISMKQAM